jgi:hypothetical protein
VIETANEDEEEYQEPEGKLFEVEDDYPVATVAQAEEDEQVHFDEKPIVESSPQVAPMGEDEEGEESKQITESNLNNELAELQHTSNG